MISFVPTSRSFRWRNIVTIPCAIAILLYVASIGSLAWLNQKTPLDLTPCPFKQVTGLPCFLCGGTRASFALAQGDVVSSFLFNPLVCVALLVTACLFLLKVVAGFRIKIVPIHRNWLWLGAILLVAVNWTWVILHLK